MIEIMEEEHLNNGLGACVTKYRLQGTCGENGCLCDQGGCKEWNFGRCKNLIRSKKTCHPAFDSRFFVANAIHHLFQGRIRGKIVRDKL